MDKNSAIIPGVSKKGFIVCDKDLDGFLDKRECMSLESRFPFLMFPIFRLQDSMQEKSLGTSWNEFHVKLSNELQEKQKNQHSSQSKFITMYWILQKILR